MGIVDLWVPIVVAAVVVFAASALVWTVLPWHRADVAGLPDEEAVHAALREAKPGLYRVPYHVDAAALRNEDVARKYEEGPQAWVTVVPAGIPRTGPRLLSSFLFYVAVNVFCAYLVTRTLDPAAGYTDVFRVTGTAAFLAYGAAGVQDSIWFGRPWSITLKCQVDALLYGMLTGGVFGWLYG